MTRVEWSKTGERYYETGLDRGMFYPKQIFIPGSIIATNLFENPSFEAGLSPWRTFRTGIFGTTVLDRVQNFLSEQGIFSVRLKSSGLGSSVNDSIGIVRQLLAIKPNTTYTTSAHWSGVPIASDKNYKTRVQVYDVDNNVVGNFTGTSNVPGRLPLEFTTPSTAERASFYFQVSGTNSGSPSEVDVFVDGLMLNEGEFIPYFDGDTRDEGLYTYDWSGARHVTISHMRTRVSAAVPWNGLTSVDEQGGQESATYYMDGRPFLHLPRPKEFEATLSAFTYPDEFSSAMGVVEAVDGMYLDSQQSESFDLSYRTLVGNDLGDSHYKIHLVYNVTVVPQNRSFSTISNEINPVDMSWAIQAVPVPVEGYRPTAHIVLDTRHIDPDKLATIEDMLYGSESSVPMMPDPQTVFDILSYGDTIVIMDNADGTWTAQGSMHNVYMIGDGVFQIENVNAVFGPDGTYTISSTP